MIHLIGNFYDPIGYLAPIAIRYKVFMQSLCELKVGWDELIPEPQRGQWQKFVSELAEARPIAIPRLYLDAVEGDISSYLLCGYRDASLTAYATVVYLEIQTSEGYYLRFVVAKTRVAPLKKQSIPRVELLSALLLSRLMEAMKSSLTPELVISSYHCFTDSRVALAWIQDADKS